MPTPRLTDPYKDLPILNAWIREADHKLRHISAGLNGVFVATQIGGGGGTGSDSFWQDLGGNLLGPIAPFVDVQLPGFISLNGLPINNTDATGYIPVFVDFTLTNTVAGGIGPPVVGGNEVRGVNATVRNLRLAADEPTLGWDFIGVQGTAVIDGSTTVNIIGKQIGIRGEVYAQNLAAPKTHSFLMGGQVSVSQIGTNNTVTTAAGLIIGQPAQIGSGGTVTNLYGLWIQNQAATSLTVTNPYGIKIDGLSTAGRIKWNGVELQEIVSGVLGFRTTTDNGLEFTYGSNTSSLTSYNRVGSAYRAFTLDGLTLEINGVSGGVIGLGGSSTAGANVQIAAGTTAKAPLRLVSGTLATSPVSGNIEWNGSNLWITQSGVRKALNPVQTKGDVYTHDASATSALAVGTNGQVLTADSTATNGIKWATSSAGTPPFSDATALLFDNVDNTKLLQVEVSGIATGTVRVWSVQNTNLTVAGKDVANNFTATQLPNATNSIDQGSTTKAWNQGFFTNSNTENLVVARTGTSFGTHWQMVDSLGVFNLLDEAGGTFAQMVSGGFATWAAGLAPNTNSAKDLGTTSLIWRNLYVAGVDTGGAAPALTLAVGGVEGFRIDSNSSNPRLLGGITSSDLSTGAGSIISASGFDVVSAATNAAVIGTSLGGGTRATLFSSKSGSGTVRPLCFDVNSVEAMRIDTSQNVGIGVTPVTRLHIYGGTGVAARIESSGTSPTVEFYGNNSGSTFWGSIIANQSTSSWADRTGLYGFQLNNAAQYVLIAANANTVLFRTTGQMEFTGVSFASLPAANNGCLIYCSDAKNIHDDGVAAGSVAAGSGHGCVLQRVNGNWLVM